MNRIRANTIQFRSGLLLSREILEEMTVQSRLFLIQYEAYPDGIISGLDWLEEKEKLYLTPGIVKYQGEYYFSREKICVTDVLSEFDKTMQGNTLYAALAFVPVKEEKNAEGIETSVLELQLLLSQKLKSQDIIIAEFQYFKKKRKWLPEQMNCHEILEAQTDTQASAYSFLNVNYSLPHEQVFSPQISRMMKNCLVEKKEKSPEDRCLLFMLSQHELISMEVLRQWFLFYKKEPDMTDRKAVIQTFLSCINTQFVIQIPKKPEIPEKTEIDFGT